MAGLAQVQQQGQREEGKGHYTWLFLAVLGSVFL
jgi:hypothetical protein